MLKEIIYDFDGTISDTYPIFTRAFIKMLEEYGIESSYDKVYADLKVNVGYAFRQHPTLDDPSHKRFHEIHIAMALEEQQPMPNALEILKYAAENGGRNYIYTHSGPEVKQLLTKWGMMPYITDIIDSSYKIPRKPNPDGVLILMENNGIKAEEAVIVGDRDIDLISGKRAGIKGCMLDPEHYYDDAERDFTVDDLIELKEIICK